MKDRIRVFVSYSSKDKKLALRLVKALKRRGLFPLWGQDIRPGEAFTDEIKQLIKRAHVFVSLLTKRSRSRPWVHQEIGYAMALNIPILPITVGVALPDQMIAHIEAIKVKANASDLSARVKATDFGRIVSGALSRGSAMVEVAEDPEDRTELIAASAMSVLNYGDPGMLRQRGTLSSFSLPDKGPRNPIWRAKEGDHPRGHGYRRLQREERRSLEKHVRVAGCRIIFHPRPLKRRDPASLSTRLGLIIEFIESLRAEPEVENRPIEFLWSPKPISDNLIIVGDWFTAESRVPRDGYEQTLFEWHAPRVRRALQEFDDEFEGADAEHR
ncbi:toll/interleukin-1 receptor domain-containing protein, partial [bacterium]|nr:toll/interleukin-1 receptor domain-containing protein [bacterium]